MIRTRVVAVEERAAAHRSHGWIQDANVTASTNACGWVVIQAKDSPIDTRWDCFVEASSEYSARKNYSRRACFLNADSSVVRCGGDVVVGAAEPEVVDSVVETRRIDCSSKARPD